jgi:hypothetical protein
MSSTESKIENDRLETIFSFLFFYENLDCLFNWSKKKKLAYLKKYCLSFIFLFLILKEVVFSFAPKKISVSLISNLKNRIISYS